MGELQKVIQFIMTGSLTFAFGLTTLFPFLWRVIVNGPKKMLYVKKRERPECLDDPALGTHKFARLKDIRLHYVESGPEDKPLMLFIHGFPEFWFSWRHQIVEFSKDFRVVAMDMRGYSESDKPAGVSSYKIDKLVEDVKQLIQFLGYEKSYIVAHDWGGAVSWRFASRFPEMVEKLIICNSPHPAAMQTLFRTSFKQILRSWYMFMFRLPVLPIAFLRADDFKFISDAIAGKETGCKPGKISADEMEVFKYTFQNYTDLTGPVNFYRAGFSYPSAAPGAQCPVTVPTLVVWGTEDAFLGPELAELSGKYVQDYRFRYVEGASHWVQQDEPELTNKYIREFVEGKMQE